MIVNCRWVGIIALTIVVFCAVCAVAETSGTCGENINWVLDDNGTLTISGTGTFSNFLDNIVGADSIKAIVFSPGITGIGNGVFANHYFLTSVTIPESVTRIGSSAFLFCTRLNSINIPDGVTYIGSSAFYNCVSLVNITIPSSVTNIPSATFSNCTRLTSIIIPESVTTLGNNVFSGCSSLTSITIPDGVTSMADYVFSGCSSLTDVSIPESMISIGKNVFEKCPNLSELIIPESVQTFGDSCFGDIAVLKCYKNSPADIWLQANGYESRIQYIFDDPATCKHTNLIVQEAYAPSYTHTGLTEGLYCGRCGTVFIAQKIIPKLGTILDEIKMMRTLKLPESLTAVEAEAFTGSSVEAVIVPGGCESIGSKAFADCTSLKYVLLRSDAVQIADDAFTGSAGVMVVHIDDYLDPLVTVSGRCWIHELFGKTIKQANLLIEDELVLEEDFYHNDYFGVQTDKQGRINYISIFKGTKYSLFNAVIGDGITATAFIGECDKEQYNWKPYNNLPAPRYMTSEYYPDRILMLTWSENNRLTSITYTSY